MARGRKRIENPVPNPAKAVRLTFRVDQDTVAHFKAIAALKNLKVEELGKLALDQLIKKEKNNVKAWQESI